MLLEELRQFEEVDFSGSEADYSGIGRERAEELMAMWGGGAGSIKKGAWTVERKICRIAPKVLCRAGDRSEAGMHSGRGCRLAPLAGNDCRVTCNRSVTLLSSQGKTYCSVTSSETPSWKKVGMPGGSR